MTIEDMIGKPTYPRSGYYNAREYPCGCRVADGFRHFKIGDLPPEALPIEAYPKCAQWHAMFEKPREQRAWCIQKHFGGRFRTVRLYWDADAAESRVAE